MFGYVKADLNKLSEDDIRAYRAVYCSLCHALKRHYGVTAQLLLNYDITFLALLRLNTSDYQLTQYERHCPYKIKKCPALRGANDVFFECATVLVILAYEKILDNVRDERFLKKLFYRFVSLLFRGKYREAAKQQPELSHKIRQNMILQNEIEKQSVSFDKAAHPTADSLGIIFQGASENEHLYRFGYLLGRWVYFIDAADDLQKDCRSGAFNPFKNVQDSRRIEEILNLSIGEASEEFERIKHSSCLSVMENILYEGSHAVQLSVLRGEAD